MSKLHANTHCRVINLADMRFEFPRNQSVLNIRAFLPDGTLIQPNFYHFWQLVKHNQGLRYFLMDHREHVKARLLYGKCTDEKEKFEKAQEYLASMTKFAKHFKKTLYLRLLPPVAVGSEKESRVFVDEVMEIIPIALKQQKTPILKKDARLSVHVCQSSHVLCEATTPTFTVTELEKILNDFDINKSLITLIPDLCYEMMRRDFMNHGAPLRFPGPDMKIVSTMHHSLNFIFTNLVVGLNWNRDNCEEHEGCNQRSRKYVETWLKEIFALGEATCVDAGLLLAIIGDQKANCMITRKTVKGMPDLQKRLDEHEAFISRYHNVTKFYNLPKYPIFVPASRKDQMPIWEFRVLGTLGWIQQFFGEEDLEIKKILVESLYFIVPDRHVEAAIEFVKSVVNSEGVGAPKRISTSSVDNASVAVLENMVKGTI